MKLNGKVAIVSGSGQGIGKATAMLFAREGATVVINDTNLDTMRSVAEEITNAGGKAFPFKANVANKAEVTDLCKATADRFGAIHILVNNAAVRRNAPLLELSESDWDLVLDVDLKAVFLFTQAVASYMMRQKYGKIINISSISALGSAGTDHASYAAAKGGVISLTKVTAKALGPYGINVNSIAPGVIETPSSLLRRGVEGNRKFQEEKGKLAVMGRVGRPEDIANLALFLASDDSSFIAGQTIACDGGRTDLMVN